MTPKREVWWEVEIERDPPGGTVTVTEDHLADAIATAVRLKQNEPAARVEVNRHTVEFEWEAPANTPPEVHPVATEHKVAPPEPGGVFVCECEECDGTLYGEKLHGKPIEAFEAGRAEALREAAELVRGVKK